MHKSVKSLFDFYFKDVVFDKKLFHSLVKFRIQWANKNDDHISFLSSNLLGVHPMRFTAADVDKLLLDILGLNYNELQTELYAVPDINQNWEVSSGVFNQTMLYLMYRFMFDSKLSSKDSYIATKEVYLIFAYRVMSSRLFLYFKYPLKEQIALEVYETLSNHFLIKRLETWNNVFEYRSKGITNKKGIHYKRLKSYTTKDSIIIINDLQGRIRSMVKEIFRVTLTVRDGGGNIATSTLVHSSKLSTGEIKDLTSNVNKNITKMLETVTLVEDLINTDYIHLIQNIIPTMVVNDLNRTLLYLAAESDKDNRKLINTIIEDMITASIQYLTSKGITDIKNVGVDTILLTLKGFWMASKVSDPNIKEIKKNGDRLAYLAIKKKTATRIASLRVGVFLYLCLMFLIMSK